MRQAQFDWRPYIIEFHAQAPKLMKSRAFVLGGVLQLRLAGNGFCAEAGMVAPKFQGIRSAVALKAWGEVVMQRLLRPSRLRLIEKNGLIEYSVDEKEKELHSGVLTIGPCPPPPSPPPEFKPGDEVVAKEWPGVVWIVEKSEPVSGILALNERGGPKMISRYPHEVTRSPDPRAEAPREPSPFEKYGALTRGWINDLKRQVSIRNCV